MRQTAQAALLDTEKKKSELSVDLAQLQHQVAALKADLRSEIEKVHITFVRPIRDYNVVRTIFWKMRKQYFIVFKLLNQFNVLKDNHKVKITTGKL